MDRMCTLDVKYTELQSRLVLTGPKSVRDCYTIMILTRTVIDSSTTIVSCTIDLHG